MRKKVVIMPTHSSFGYNEKLLYLEEVINNLYEDDNHLLPVFLLRCQLIEFSLKYLLIHYPFKDKGFIDEEKIEELTLGQTVSKLREIKDSYMDNIVKNAEKLKDLRNDLTHNFIKSDISIDAMNVDIEECMELADQIEQNIYYYFDYVNEIYFGKNNRLF